MKSEPCIAWFEQRRVMWVLENRNFRWILLFGGKNESRPSPFPHHDSWSLDNHGDETRAWVHFRHLRVGSNPLHLVYCIKFVFFVWLATRKMNFTIEKMKVTLFIA